MAVEQWYYCMDHALVETFEECDSDNRLGPYPSQAAAKDALEAAAKRNKAFDEDPRFNDEEPDDEEKVRFDGAPLD